MHGARTELYVPKKKKVYINYKAQYLHKAYAGKKILAVDLQYQSGNTMYQGENTIVDLNFNLFLTNHPLYHFTLSNARYFYFHDKWRSRLGDKHPDFKKHPDHPRQVYFLFTLVVGINDHR